MPKMTMTMMKMMTEVLLMIMMTPVILGMTMMKMMTVVLLMIMMTPVILGMTIMPEGQRVMMTTRHHQRHRAP